MFADNIFVLLVVVIPEQFVSPPIFILPDIVVVSVVLSPKFESPETERLPFITALEIVAVGTDIEVAVNEFVVMLPVFEIFDEFNWVVVMVDEFIVGIDEAFKVFVVMVPLLFMVVELTVGIDEAFNVLVVIVPELLILDDVIAPNELDVAVIELVVILPELFIFDEDIGPVFTAVIELVVSVFVDILPVLTIDAEFMASVVVSPVIVASFKTIRFDVVVVF